MRQLFKIVVALLGLMISAISSATHEVTVSCMMVYDEGGAPAVLESPDCPQWGILAQSQNRTRNCQFAMLQGLREYQEDRVVCNLDMKIPFAGKDGIKEVLVGVAAVFDGHGGKEASQMASENLLDYFFVHVVFNAYKQALPCKAEGDLVFQGREEAGHVSFNLVSPGEGLPEPSDESMHQILKKSLSLTIRDIDSKFALEAFNNRYVSGSTATVVLLVDGQILVANVGDSKALLCSKKSNSASGAEVLDVEELTRDHRPDRDDEKARIEAAGGFVRTWGMPRVNGILAVSRAIGDVYLKRYGVSPVPEVMGWRRLTGSDSYLVVASDGIFESLTPQNACDLLRDANIQESSCSCKSSSSFADCIVNKAFKKGSGDNLSAIVIPVNLTSS